jgi:hypothetical protein
MRRFNRRNITFQLVGGIVGAILGTIILGYVFSFVFEGLKPIIGTRYLVHIASFFEIAGMNTTNSGLWWDAAIVLYGILGLALGSSFGMYFVSRYKKMKGSTLGIFFGGFLIGSILNLCIYDYDPSKFSPIIQVVLMVIIPAITSLIGFYYKDLILLCKK